MHRFRVLSNAEKKGRDSVEGYYTSLSQDELKFIKYVYQICSTFPSGAPNSQLTGLQLWARNIVKVHMELKDKHDIEWITALNNCFMTGEPAVQIHGSFFGDLALHRFCDVMVYFWNDLATSSKNDFLDLLHGKGLWN